MLRFNSVPSHQVTDDRLELLTPLTATIAFSNIRMAQRPRNFPYSQGNGCATARRPSPRVKSHFFQRRPDTDLPQKRLLIIQVTCNDCLITLCKFTAHYQASLHFLLQKNQPFCILNTPNLCSSTKHTQQYAQQPVSNPNSPHQSTKLTAPILARSTINAVYRARALFHISTTHVQSTPSILHPPFSILHSPMSCFPKLVI
jgi:hypothetical protein